MNKKFSDFYQENLFRRRSDGRVMRRGVNDELGANLQTINLRQLYQVGAWAHLSPDGRVTWLSSPDDNFILREDRPEVIDAGHIIPVYSDQLDVTSIELNRFIDEVARRMI